MTMRFLFPAGAIAAIGWLVGRPGWQHLHHVRQIGSVLAIAAPFMILFAVACVARSRRQKARSAASRSPYSVIR